MCLAVVGCWPNQVQKRSLRTPASLRLALAPARIAGACAAARHVLSHRTDACVRCWLRRPPLAPHLHPPPPLEPPPPPLAPPPSPPLAQPLAAPRSEPCAARARACQCTATRRSSRCSW